MVNKSTVKLNGGNFKPLIGTQQVPHIANGCFQIGACTIASAVHILTLISSNKLTLLIKGNMRITIKNRNI